jgi:hypothetical protein
MQARRTAPAWSLMLAKASVLVAVWSTSMLTLFAPSSLSAVIAADGTATTIFHSLVLVSVMLGILDLVRDLLRCSDSIAVRRQEVLLYAWFAGFYLGKCFLLSSDAPWPDGGAILIAFYALMAGVCAGIATRVSIRSGPCAVRSK